MITDKEIRDNIATYYDDVLMPGGWHHNLPETLKQIDAYYMGKYMKGGIDTNGDPIPFENITKPTIDVAEKLIEIDTKNVLFLPEDMGIRNTLYLMRKDFQEWSKKNDLAELFNESGHVFPKYGHVITKQSKDKKQKITKIQNLRVNPSYQYLEEMPFVCELLSMTKQEIDEMGWDSKDLGEGEYTVYEYYTRNTDKGKKWLRTFRTKLFLKAKGNKTIETTESQYVKGKAEYLPSIELYADEVDELPYEEAKFEDVPGRWLGLGFAELLFDEQAQTNKVCYLRGKTMLKNALNLYITKDDTIGKNAAEDFDFNQIINTYDDLSPVSTGSNADLSSYNTETNRIDSLINRKTHNTDIVMGENLPSQTPLGLGRLQASFTMSFFNKKREMLGLFFVRLIENNYLNLFLKDKGKAHPVMFPKSAEDFEIMLQSQMEIYKQDILEEHYKETGTIMAWGEVEQLAAIEEEKIRNSGELAISVPDKAYKDLKYSVTVEITGESVDIKTKQSIYQFALSTLSSNPQLLANPSTRELFFRLIEQTGESSAKIGLLRDSVRPEPQQNLQALPAMKTPQPQPVGQPDLQQL